MITVNVPIVCHIDPEMTGSDFSWTCHFGICLEENQPDSVKSWRCLSFRGVSRKESMQLTLPPASFLLSWAILATCSFIQKEFYHVPSWLNTHPNTYRNLFVYLKVFLLISVYLLGLNTVRATVLVPPRQFQATSPAHCGTQPTFSLLQGVKPWLVMAEKIIWRRNLEPGLNDLIDSHFFFFLLRLNFRKFLSSLEGLRFSWSFAFIFSWHRRREAGSELGDPHRGPGPVGCSAGSWPAGPRHSWDLCAQPGEGSRRTALEPDCPARLGY